MVSKITNQWSGQPPSGMLSSLINAVSPACSAAAHCKRYAYCLVMKDLLLKPLPKFVSVSVLGVMISGLLFIVCVLAIAFLGRSASLPFGNTLEASNLILTNGVSPKLEKYEGASSLYWDFHPIPELYLNIFDRSKFANELKNSQRVASELENISRKVDTVQLTFSSKDEAQAFMPLLCQWFAKVTIPNGYSNEVFSCKK